MEVLTQAIMNKVVEEEMLLQDDHENEMTNNNRSWRKNFWLGWHDKASSGPELRRLLG